MSRHVQTLLMSIACMAHLEASYCQPAAGADSMYPLTFMDDEAPFVGSQETNCQHMK